MLAEGHHFDENGIVDTSSTFYRVYKDGIVIPCEESAGVTCAGTDFVDQTAAENTFNNKYSELHPTQGDKSLHHW